MSPFTLKPSAYFKIYTPEGEDFECGIIFLSATIWSRNLFSKKMAYNHLHTAFQDGLIDKDERAIIGQQIKDSLLPETISIGIQLLSTLYARIEILYDEILADIDELDDELFPTSDTTDKAVDEKKGQTIH